MIEPGRSLVAPVGVTLYRVLTLKQAGQLHVAVDGGMGDNLEYSLYGQRFAPLVVGRWDEPEVLADLVGRHCESGDIVTPDVELRSPQVGDLVVVPVTGAYCFTMVNNYNGALRPPVIYCADGVARLGVRRETPEELLAREVDLVTGGLAAADAERGQQDEGYRGSRESAVRDHHRQREVALGRSLGSPAWWRRPGRHAGQPGSDGLWPGLAGRRPVQTGRPGTRRPSGPP